MGDHAPVSSGLPIAAGLAATALFVALAYRLRWQWTGLPAGEADGRPAKTLWDWLGLLGIPLVLAILGFALSEAQDRRDRRREDQREAQQRARATDAEYEATLKGYLDQISELMLDRGLLRSGRGADVRDVARTATLTAVRRLDGERRGLVVRFLAESGLLTPRGSRKRMLSIDDEPDVRVRLASAELGGAHLRGAKLLRVNLDDAALSGANLFRSRLSNVEMSAADLAEANLQGAQVIDADLSQADLRHANLRGTTLLDTDLSAARLDHASLRGANLLGVDLSTADMAGVDLGAVTVSGKLNLYSAYLRGARMRRMDLTSADVRGADLRDADLTDADLRYARLARADFKGAVIAGADFRGARRANLAGAIGKPAHAPP